MQLHARAALTLRQRQQVRLLHDQRKLSIRRLACRFGVNPSTIQRWVGRACPLDRSSAPKRPHRRTTAEYRQAVIAYRQAHPREGPIRIAQALQEAFPEAHRGTVLPLLQQEGLTRPRRAPRSKKPLEVGFHRLQMDIQRLPCIEGQKGFEYKISLIHMRTRLKYSEIHDNHRSATVVRVVQRAMDFLPPFS